MAVTFDEMIKCLRRELAMRQRVYPRWVQQAKMKQRDADRELAAMQAVHDTLTKMVEAIRHTASDGTYSETAIRKAVAFELAETIVEARAAMPVTGTPPDQAGRCSRTPDMFG